MKQIYQPTSLSCFLCGRDNPIALGIKWINNYEKNQVETDFTIPDTYCSYKGTTHGGIIATLLDETIGRAILINNEFDRLMVTMKLETIYKKPTPTGVPIKIIGRVVKDSGTRAIVEGEIVLPDGVISATATAVLFKIPDSVKQGWDEAELKEWQRTMPDLTLAEETRKKYQK